MSSASRTEGCLGKVKWFNNKNGYGFITALEGDHVGLDVFAHHSGVTVGSEQYRYLVQGEYVSFDIISDDTQKDRKFHAENITGVLGGMLMCETKHLNKVERENSSKKNGGAQDGGSGEGETQGQTWSKVV
tara:strand:+ start:2737 stop:3129 length:393 start_codon:yes stop_codon:yes gene_type:complete